MNEYNPASPTVMHIDLNSCFATVEQQARPMLRGRPVAIVNRRTEHTMIVTASYEAKAMGVKLGDKRIGSRIQAHQHTRAVIADIARAFEKLCQLPDEWSEANALYFAANA